MSTQDEKKIRWVSPVDGNDISGGGVSKVVRVLKETGIPKKYNFNYLSLKNLSVTNQIKQAFLDIYTKKYNIYILHSILSPYSIFIIICSVRAKILIIPHGELNPEALKIKKHKKKLALIIIKYFTTLNHSKKYIELVVSNLEDTEQIKKIIKIKTISCLPELLPENASMKSFNRIDQTEPLNLVCIGRLVENKGVSFLLKAVEQKLKSLDKNSWIQKIDNIHIYYSTFDEIELKNVKKVGASLKNKYKINVKLTKGMNTKQIEEDVKKINNKVPFLPSKFESFSYTLIEMLCFEYKPIVWYSNSLVKELTNKNICIALPPGEFDDVYQNLPEKQKLDEAESFISYIRLFGIKEYNKIFERCINNDF